jgi:hypothetical protein
MPGPDRGALRPEDTVTDEYLTASGGPMWDYTRIADTDREQDRVWPPLTVHKASHYVEVPHELLVDSGEHTCDATCLTLYGNAYLRIPPPLPWPTRVRYALRRARWRLARLGGLRLVHKDRIDQDQDRDD